MRRLVSLVAFAALIASSSAGRSQTYAPDDGAAGAAAGAAILGGVVGGLLGAGIDRRVHRDDRLGVMERGAGPIPHGRSAGHPDGGHPGGGRGGGKGDAGKGGRPGKGHKPETQ